jgi:hypothetical protein
MNAEIDRAYARIEEAFARGTSGDLGQELLRWHQGKVALLSSIVEMTESNTFGASLATDAGEEACDSRLVEIARKRNGHPAKPKENGILSARGRCLFYYPSRRAVEMLKSWENGAKMQWVLAEESGLPIAIHLAPAADGDRKLRLYFRSNVRPHMTLPTSQVGGVVRTVRGYIKETRIAADGIAIAIPDIYFTRYE